MIELGDPIWNELDGNYGSGSLVAGLIAQAEAGVPIDNWYEDLFQGLCHQYTVSEAAYAAAPHLVRIAASPGAPRLELLILLGGCYTFSNAPEDAVIPAGLEEEWNASARAAIPLLAELLAEPHSEESELCYLLSCLAAFNGHKSLARTIESLDSNTG